MAFQRKFRLIVAHTHAITGIDVSQLRCTFHVKKTLTPEANYADIRVYNLSANSQALLSGGKALSVSLEAGYEDEGTSRIFVGEVRSADTKQDGPNYVTRMDTEDKGKKLQTTRINAPIRIGAPIEDVIRLILGAFNQVGSTEVSNPIGEGNLRKAMADLYKLGITSLHPRGGLLNGYAAMELTDLCKGANLEWSIQDGALFLNPIGGQYGKRSLVLSAATGLIKSPVVDNEGVMTAETLIVPGIYPGAIVDFDAKFLKGGYRITQIDYRGDTHGLDWHAKIRGTKF